VLVATIGALAVTSLALAGPAAAQSSGEVNVSGSSTVEPITSLVAELFAEKNPDVAVRVDGPGTGDGFKLFCNDETDISDASRAIKDEEAAECETKGITYTELPVGLDGLTVIVNKSSSLGLKCLSQGDLYGLFGPESSGDLVADSAIADEVGSTQGLPAKGTVKKFTPGPESGTYDSFIELGYQEIMDTRLEEGKITDVTPNDEGENEPTEPLISDGQFPNDNDIVKRVEGSKNGIGFLGLAYYLENQDQVTAIAIENPETGKCVKPSEKTVQSGAYVPLARPLFIYVNDAKAASNSALKSFVDFYMTKKTLTKTVEEAGYAPLAAADIQASINTWKSAG
jgi:phosphate transport system substrate-binding protein